MKEKEKDLELINKGKKVVKELDRVFNLPKEKEKDLVNEKEFTPNEFAEYGEMRYNEGVKEGREEIQLECLIMFEKEIDKLIMVHLPDGLSSENDAVILNLNMLKNVVREKMKGGNKNGTSYNDF